MYPITYGLWSSLIDYGLVADTNDWVEYTMRYSIEIALGFLYGFVVLQFQKGRTDLLDFFGLKKGSLFGWTKSFLFTLPMLAGYSLIAPINPDLTSNDVIFWSVVAPFSEELLFRGLLFGALYKILRWGFFPSILVVSILFAIGHIYQAEGLGELFGVMAITFVGSLVLAWMYVEWDYNLWVPIGTHILMNLYWNLFDIEASNAIGGLGANIFRLATIILIVVLTIRKIKSSGSNLKGQLLKRAD